MFCGEDLKTENKYINDSTSYRCDIDLRFLFNFNHNKSNQLTAGWWRTDEAMYVCVYKCSHQELAVKPVHNPTMPRNDVSEVLLIKWCLKFDCKYYYHQNVKGKYDLSFNLFITYLNLECPFEPACEEPSKWTNDRCKDRHEKCMDKDWIDSNRLL